MGKTTCEGRNVVDSALFRDHSISKTGHSLGYKGRECRICHLLVGCKGGIFAELYKLKYSRADNDEEVDTYMTPLIRLPIPVICRCSSTSRKEKCADSIFLEALEGKRT